MKNINAINNKYKGFWISVSEDDNQVYASAKTLEELISKAKK